ncbi:MAG: YlxR family protein [Paenibacillaceae bacterium]|jgi:predicted RNA-binding protein YlxR (DUF448 family)|nr:YlxR family protein [Paenibacillaceae bacterium]
MNTRHVPMRTCVACRKTFPKAELLRIVRPPQSPDVVLDEQGTMLGRGAYVCAQLPCLTRALKAKTLERALRCPLHAQLIERIRAIGEGGRVSS